MFMDDDEDFEALFFSEARELLDALQEHLNLLADGEGDEETVHAAFRAVHSVKGGAAAFGFDQLISFAHVFETVMDQVRDKRTELTHDLSQLLLRSADVMQVLVENAQNGDTSPVNGLDRLKSELEVIAGLEPEPAPAEEAPAAQPVPEADSSSADEPELREIAVRISPDADFFSSGHDLLKLVRAARQIGLASVHVDGALPDMKEFNPEVCPLTWELNFRTEDTVESIAAFLEVYAHTAQIEYLDPLEHEDMLDLPDDESEEGSGGGSDGGSDGGSGPAATSQDADEPDAGETAEKPAAARPTASKAPDPEAKAGGGPASRGADPNKSLRVEITRIDRLVNLVGEMLITQAAVAQRLIDEEKGDNSGTDMAHAVDTMSRQLRELQESVMAIRAQPVKSVFRRMPRVVRDLADTLGKEARIELYGEHTEVDATVIEELSEPLTHMIRNSMDHGLEHNDVREKAGKPPIGTIKLSADQRGERVIITIEDDGKGVDRERVLSKAIERGLVSPEDTLSPEDIDLLIFHPGFSTAAEVSAVSGRGVGMDVVKKKIQALGGRCTVVSNPGVGTRFEITLPLTLAVMDGMTIAVHGQHYILPLSSVVEALRVTGETGKTLPDGSRVVERRGEYLRLISLREALQLPPRDCDLEMAVIVDTDTSGPVAVIVDELIGQRQVVLKSLEANFKHVNGISGATILGDGQVALILDVPSLMASLGGASFSQEYMQ